MTAPSCHPIAAVAALASPHKPGYDLRWLITDADYAWLDANRAPALASISLEVRFGYLVLRAPGMLRLDIPMDVEEDETSPLRQAAIGGQSVQTVDEGDLAAAWLEDYLGQSARLVKIHPAHQQIDWPANARP